MFSFPDAGRFLKVEIRFPALETCASGVAIDTRRLKQGDLFVALRGTREDGHHYLSEAFRKGASGAIVGESVYASRPEIHGNPNGLYHNLLPVSDPGKALLALAGWYRSGFDPVAIGITGSLGKTTTKEFLSYLLGRNLSVLASPGNYNNQLGVPLTLFGLEPGHRFCIAELGANHPGEIASLAACLRPLAAILTPISEAHLEGFGDLETIYRSKLELVAALPEGAPVVLPDRDRRLLEKIKAYDIKPILVGEGPTADYRVTHVHVAGGSVRFDCNGRLFIFRGEAGFFAQNAAMALALADQLGVALAEVPERWDDFRMPQGRFERIPLGNGRTAIHDGYNANPRSFEAALEAFRELPVEGRKFLLIGDMLELGKEEERFHAELGRRIADESFECVVAYGPRSQRSVATLRELAPGLTARHFKSAQEAAQSLVEQMKPGDAVLLKASRGMKVEEVLYLFKVQCV